MARGEFWEAVTGCVQPLGMWGGANGRKNDDGAHMNARALSLLPFDI